ncbi:hypothetical protein BDF19DRAFT_413103 [Syncephalis fuscata]|nr:hypothetical protein BDF19DRAFT_413103 [Syncephalis fuscata]
MAPSAGHPTSSSITTNTATPSITVSSPPVSNKHNNQEPILYDADVIAEWSPDDEAAASLAHTAGTSIAELPKRMLNKVRQKITRPLDGSSGIAVNLHEQWSQRRGDWPIALSPDGRALAVWRDTTLELRYADDGFSIARATITTSEDELPLWRQLTWSLDGQLLAFTGSDAIVQIIDLSGHLLWRLASTRSSQSGTSAVLPIDISTDVNTNASISTATATSTSTTAATDTITVMEPMAALIFKSPRNLIDHHSTTLLFTHELLTIACDGTLCCFQLKYSPNESFGKRKRDDESSLSSSSSTSASTASAILRHTFSFSSTYSIVTTATYIPDKDVLCVAGWPLTTTGSNLSENVTSNTSTSTTSASLLVFWQFTNRSPYYKLIVSSNAITAPSSKSLISTINEREEHVVDKLRDMWTRWRLPGSETVPLLIHLVSVSPLGNAIATLAIDGEISVWQLDNERALTMRIKWTRNQLQHLIEQAIEDDTESAPLPDTVISLYWWDKDRLIIGFASGIIAAVSIDDTTCTNCLGNKPLRLRTSAPLICHSTFGALVLEKDIATSRVRIQGDRIYISSSSDDNNDGHINSDDELASTLTTSSSGYQALVQLSKMAVHSLAYLTDTFLWQFENDAWKAARGRYVTFERRTFRLIVILQISPAELMQRHIALMEYDEALHLAHKHHLNADPIYQARWLDADVCETSIEQYLSQIKHRLWVLDSCLTRVPFTPEAMRLLIDYGLERTQLPLREKLSDYTEEELIIWQYRWKLLDYSDRLETWKLIAADRVDDVSFVDDYAYFRNVNLVAQSIEYAYQGLFSALTILFERHTVILRPFRLFILNQIPESISPELYQHLLPRVHMNDVTGHSEEITAWSSHPWRVHDILPLEMEKALKQSVGWLDDAHDLGFASFPISSTEYPATTDQLTTWYKERARNIDEVSGRLDYAQLLLELGITNKVDHLTLLIEDAKFLYQLCYVQRPTSLTWTGQTLRLFERSPITSTLSLMFSRVLSDQIVDVLHQLAIPYLQHRQQYPRLMSIEEGEEGEEGEQIHGMR